MATVGNANNNGHVDWMCIVRYAIYGALIGGLVGNQFSTDANVVYLTAFGFGVVFVLAKVLFLGYRK